VDAEPGQRPPERAGHDRGAAVLVLAAAGVALGALLVAGLVALAVSGRAAEYAAERLHLAAAEDVAEAERRAERAETQASVALAHDETELRRFEEALGMVQEEMMGLTAVMGGLQAQVDGITDVGRIEDLGFRIDDTQQRLARLEDQLDRLCARSQAC
jgi:hypothetical protein